MAGLFRPERYDAGTGLDPDALARSISDDGVRASHIPRVEEIVDRLVPELEPGDVVLILSNGAFGGIHGKLLGRLRSR